MDGRVQLPVIRYLQERFKVDYVDVITEAGPNLILSEGKNVVAIQTIFDRLAVSVENHDSVGIAVVGHHDCAGNPAPREDQITHTQNAAKLLRQKYDDIEIICLWVDEEWAVCEISESESDD